MLYTIPDWFTCLVHENLSSRCSSSRESLRLSVVRSIANMLSCGWGFPQTPWWNSLLPITTMDKKQDSFIIYVCIVQQSLLKTRYIRFDNNIFSPSNYNNKAFVNNLIYSHKRIPNYCVWQLMSRKSILGTM